jgi:tRNA-modifying protein YgfZ
MTTMITIGQLDPASVDAPVAAHHGDPMREQRLLLTEAGVVDRSHRGVLTLTGPERLAFLHNLTTQHLTGLADGQGSQALLLSPHGHIEHHLWLGELDGVLWLDVEPGTQADLLAFLTRMRFFTQVEIEDAGAGWGIWSLVGPRGEDALRRLGVEPPVEARLLAVPGPKFATGTLPPEPTSRYELTRLPTDGADPAGFVRRTAAGFDLMLPRATAARTLDRLAVPRAGLWAYEALRVAARRPRLGFETDHRTLPAEVDLIGDAVHLEKGCYRGQETVARVHHLGRPPRALRMLHLDGIATDELPAPGTPVLSGERAVGFTGTAARHAELGQIALAVVKRNISADTPLMVGESSAAIDIAD